MATPDLPTTSITSDIQSIWKIPFQAYGCSNCSQVYLVADGQKLDFCPNCANPKLVPQPARLRGEAPELLLPFQKQPAELLPIYQKFASAVWLRPDDFSAEKLNARSIPLYLPMWMVDSDISGSWQVQAGFDYQVKSSNEYFRDGQWRTQEVMENWVRWEPRLGQVRRHYDNATVPALSAHARYLELLGNYSFSSAAAYQPTQLGKAFVQVPDLQPQNAWPIAQSVLQKLVAQDCQKAAASQHVQNFSIQAAYELLHWTQLLLPVYASYYSDDDGRLHPVYINGQTGGAGGLRLASQRQGWKWAGILAGTAAAFFLLGLLSFAFGALVPPVAAIGTLLIVVGFILAACAVIPAAWPWQWNRKQQPPRVQAKQ